MKIEFGNVVIVFVAGSVVALGAAILHDKIEKSKRDALEKKERIKQL